MVSWRVQKVSQFDELNYSNTTLPVNMKNFDWQHMNEMGLSFINSIPQQIYTWWRHQMEAFSALLAICAGNSPVPGEFPTQRPVTRSFDVFFDLPLNKRLSKQWWGWWFETLSRPLWPHRNVHMVLFCLILFLLYHPFPMVYRTYSTSFSKGCCIATVTIILLPQCLWSNPAGYS